MISQPASNEEPGAHARSSDAIAATLSIEVWFDLICPWCLIGKRQLEQALARFRLLHPECQVAVHWRSQQLLTDIPPQGLPFHEFYLRRLGGAGAVAARQAQVRAAASKVGLSLDFSAMAVMPNTRAAHALIADAQDQRDPATVDALIEDLFAAHFAQGRNLNDEALLDALGRRHALARSHAASPLEPRGTGVPLFGVNRVQALSGAQPPERLLALLQRAARATGG